VSGYAIAASDGTIGHVEDFIVDARDWKIHWLEVDTRNRLPGRHVMVAPRHVQRVDWAQRQVHVTLSREAVRGCPEYNATSRAGPDRACSDFRSSGAAPSFGTCAYTSASLAANAPVPPRRIKNADHRHRQERETTRVRGLPAGCMDWRAAVGVGLAALASAGAAAELRIVRPAPDEVVHSNIGTVVVVVAGAPPRTLLQPVLDGEARGQPQTAPAFELQGVHRGTHELSVVPVDGAGRTAAQSPSVRFHVWQASRLQPRGRKH
jgi:hypothetical protein